MVHTTQYYTGGNVCGSYYIGVKCRKCRTSCPDIEKSPHEGGIKKKLRNQGKKCDICDISYSIV